jgi:hypothetical protein
MQKISLVVTYDLPSNQKSAPQKLCVLRSGKLLANAIKQRS